MYISLPRLHPTGLPAWDRHDKCKHILSNNPCKKRKKFRFMELYVKRHQNMSFCIYDLKICVSLLLCGLKHKLCLNIASFGRIQNSLGPIIASSVWSVVRVMFLRCWQSPSSAFQPSLYLLQLLGEAMCLHIIQPVGGINLVHI